MLTQMPGRGKAALHGLAYVDGMGGQRMRDEPFEKGFGNN